MNVWANGRWMDWRVGERRRDRWVGGGQKGDIVGGWADKWMGGWMGRGVDG